MNDKQRVEFIKQALDLNTVQAELTSELLKDIPNDKLKDFFAFRLNYVEEMRSKELITKMALFDFKKKIGMEMIRNGKRHKDIETMIAWIKTFFKGQDLCYGAASYYDYVIIAMNKDGQLINKFAVNEHGKYLVLDGKEEVEVYEWLFKNQDRIGVIKHVPYFEPKMLERKEKEEEDISDEVLTMLKFNRF